MLLLKQQSMSDSTMSSEIKIVNLRASVPLEMLCFNTNPGGSMSNVGGRNGGREGGRERLMFTFNKLSPFLISRLKATFMLGCISESIISRQRVVITLPTHYM